MKKFQYFLATLLTPAIITAAANSALAQRKNTTSHDIRPAQLQQKDQPQENWRAQDADCVCHGKKDCKKHCLKSRDKPDKKHKKQKWLRDSEKDIDEKYHDAVEEINKSDLNDAQKTLFINQAEANKQLMLKQLQERQQLLQQQMQDYQEQDLPMHDKDDRKIIKEISKILIDD